MSQSDLQQTLRRFFGEWAQGDAPDQAIGDLWARSVEMGLPWISLPEERAGGGGELQDVVELLVEVGRHGVPLPYAETALLGGWLHAAAGRELPLCALTVVPGRPDDSLVLAGGRVSGVAHRVAFADLAETVLAIVGAPGEEHIVGLWVADARVRSGATMAGEPRSDLAFDDNEPIFHVGCPAGVSVSALRLRGALSRVALMAGALEAATDLTVEYSTVREQFGRPLAKFQAIQAHLVTAVQETELVQTALWQAVRAVGEDGGRFEVAAAKVLANEAADVVSRAAHQVHGAMGFTQEYALHRSTRRLWSWKAEYGDTAFWAQNIGELAADVGADGLYPMIAGGSEALR